MSSTRRRVVAATVGIATVAVGLSVHGLLPDSVATDIAGDSLYALLIVLAVVAMAPRMRSVAVGTIALAWCVAVELFQLTGIPVQWSERVPPIALVLGAGFDPRDIVVYAATVVVAVGIDARIRRRA